MFDSFGTIVMGMTAGLQNVVETDQVGLDISVRVGDGIADTGLCGEIYYDIRFVVCKNLIYQGFVSQISFVEFVTGIRMSCRTFLNFFQTPFLMDTS